MKRLVLAACLILAACGGRQDETRDPAPANLPGVYEGVFPCANCPGIETKLWLNGDGRYFLRQAYLEDTGDAGMTTATLGSWRWLASGRELVLEGSGPRRAFRRDGEGGLLLETASDLEHRLARAGSQEPFEEKLRLTGMIRVTSNGTTFEECLTGLVVPVERGGDFNSLARQYRRAASPGEAVFAEFEGRFRWSGADAPQAVVIERFNTLRPDTSCPLKGR